MNFKLFVIFDNKSKTFGDVLSFHTDEEAKRYFMQLSVSCPWYEDLFLMDLGEISTYCSSSDTELVGVKIVPRGDYFRILCSGDEIKAEVDKLLEEKAKYDSIHTELAKVFKQPQFCDDVVKLSRYLQKHDKKRFNK